MRNALEAMQESGTLKICTSEKDDKCTVIISDTGCGMTKEQINHLFEPFFTTKKSGTGLGMANTHNIILSHNGTIKVESHENAGTVITIQLAFA
jgi:two-component system sensor histidine kinase AtoS